MYPTYQKYLYAELFQGDRQVVPPFPPNERHGHFVPPHKSYFWDDLDPNVQPLLNALLAHGYLAWTGRTNVQGQRQVFHYVTVFFRTDDLDHLYDFQRWLDEARRAGVDFDFQLNPREIQLGEVRDVTFYSLQLVFPTVDELTNLTHWLHAQPPHLDLAKSGG